MLFETANPRHGHERRVLRDHRADIPNGRPNGQPNGRILVFEVFASPTNVVEPAAQVAKRPRRVVVTSGLGPVMARTNCSLCTFAGFGAVNLDIADIKPRTLSEWVVLASV